MSPPAESSRKQLGRAVFIGIHQLWAKLVLPLGNAPVTRRAISATGSGGVAVIVPDGPAASGHAADRTQRSRRDEFLHRCFSLGLCTQRSVSLSLVRSLGVVQPHHTLRRKPRHRRPRSCTLGIRSSGFRSKFCDHDREAALLFIPAGQSERAVLLKRFQDGCSMPRPAKDAVVESNLASIAALLLICRRSSLDVAVPLAA